MSQVVSTDGGPTGWPQCGASVFCPGPRAAHFQEGWNMGREVKRVALDFDWPVGKVWDGFLNPWYCHRADCAFCEGTGYNPPTKQIADDWYDFGSTGNRWCDKLTQDEVDKLIEQNRLWDFWRLCTSEGWRDIERTKA